MEPKEPWLALKRVPGVGNLIYKRLLDRFGTPQNIFRASPAELMHVKGVSEKLAGRIGRCRVSDGERAELDLASRRGYRIVTFADPEYPALLAEIPDPPPYLYLYGNLPPGGNCVAMVGSRHATDYGLRTTLRLARDLADLGFTIVSGMAVGIDTAAHRGALAGRGTTVAVLGSGLENIYPAENRDLFHAIARQGAVISEFPLHAEPEAHNFPMRNRIISGMSLGTVVVEATLRSGSLITARLAAEQNREVFAVPGSISSFKSTGTHTLIKQGAKLVEQARDITEEFGHLGDHRLKNGIAAPAPGARDAVPALTGEERAVWNALDCYPVHIDVLSVKTGLAAGALAAILLHLELKGLVQKSPGNQFCLKP